MGERRGKRKGERGKKMEGREKEKRGEEREEDSSKGEKRKRMRGRKQGGKKEKRSIQVNPILDHETKISIFPVETSEDDLTFSESRVRWFGC